MESALYWWSQLMMKASIRVFHCSQERAEKSNEKASD